jgi:hypothetical protein
MNTIVIEHVALSELPTAWRSRLTIPAGARVTVRIEQESTDQEEALTNNPLFGMWKDREEMTDVSDYARQLRASRYKDGAVLSLPPMLSIPTQSMV